jgi:hypothetical protein
MCFEFDRTSGFANHEAVSASYLPRQEQLGERCFDQASNRPFHGASSKLRLETALLEQHLDGRGLPRKINLVSVHDGSAELYQKPRRNVEYPRSRQRFVDKHFVDTIVELGGEPCLGGTHEACLDVAAR